MNDIQKSNIKKLRNERLKRWEEFHEKKNIALTKSSHYSLDYNDYEVYKQFIKTYIGLNGENEVYILLLGFTERLLSLIKDISSGFKVKVKIIDYYINKEIKNILSGLELDIELIAGEWQLIKKIFQNNFFDIILGDAVFSNLLYEDIFKLISLLRLKIKDTGIFIFREITKASNFYKVESLLDDFMNKLISEEDFYIRLRFNSVITQNLFTKEKDLDGGKFFIKLEEFIKNGSLKKEEKIILEKIILKMKNRIIHTILDISEYIKIFNHVNFFPTVLELKGCYSLFFYNPEFILFDVLDDKKIRVNIIEEKKKIILKYISEVSHNKIRKLKSFNPEKDILHIVFPDWDIGNIGNFFLGEMKSSLVKVFYEEPLSYMSSFWIYNLYETRFRITDFIFREGYKKRDLIVKIINEKNEIMIHQGFSSLVIEIPESIIKELYDEVKDDIILIYDEYKAYLEKELIESRDIVEFIDLSEIAFFKFLKQRKNLIINYDNTKIKMENRINFSLSKLEPKYKNLLSVLIRTLLFGDYSKGRFNHLRYLHYIVQPSIYYSAKEFTSCGFMFFSNFILDEIIIDEVRDKLNNYIKSYDSFKLSQKVRKDVLYHSIKSGISAIMSRNMSHNIGSHVIADMVSKGINVSEGDLNSFFRYLQNRMDFIAQITAEFPEWTYPAYFNKELMKIFYESYILIDRIGISDGLSSYDWTNDWRQGNMRSKIIIRTCITEWEKKEDEVKNKFYWGINEYHMGNLNNDLQLAIPGGIVGYHAFYIIIENIIRNSAKYAYASRIYNRLKVVDGIINDEIIVIRYENINKCKYWIIRNELNDIEINGNELNNKIDTFRAIIIESTCFKVEKKINLEGEFDFLWELDENSDSIIIKLIDENILTSKIIGKGRLFIACIVDLHKDKCNHNIQKNAINDCLMVDKNYWQEKKIYYHLLTSYEFKKLENDYKIPKSKVSIFSQENQKERYNNIINFLQKGPLRINIRIDNMLDKDYVWVTIWDNMRHKPSVEFNKDNDANYEVSGNSSVEDMKKRIFKVPSAPNGNEYKIVNLFGYINDRLRQSFIKETGELKKEDWGLAELKICAGFLQNRKLEEIGSSGQGIIQYGNNCFDIDSNFILNEAENSNTSYPKMIIKALPVDKTGQFFKNDDSKKEKKNILEKKDFYFLGYRFWMKKPKIVAITGECSPKGAA